MEPYSPTDKQEQEKHIRWKENPLHNYKESFLDPLIIYSNPSKELEKIISSLSEPVT